MQNISGKDFINVINQEKYVVVDFWATWCGPCKMLAPVFEKVSAELSDNIDFVKVDIDSNQQIAIENKIYTIPTLVIFKNGQEVARRSGYMSENELKYFITNNCK